MVARKNNELLVLQNSPYEYSQTHKMHNLQRKKGYVPYYAFVPPGNLSVCSQCFGIFIYIYNTMPVSQKQYFNTELNFSQLKRGQK